MRTIVIPRVLVYWALMAFVVVALTLATIALWRVSGAASANQRALERVEVERVEREAAVAGATRVTCERQNDLRETLRGTIRRGADFRREQGTLTPAAERFFSREIRELANIDCDALVPDPVAPDKETP